MLLWLHAWWGNDKYRYPFKYATRYDEEELFCYLSEVDTIQDVISKFMRMMVGKTLQPSKYYGARIVHRGK